MGIRRGISSCCSYLDDLALRLSRGFTPLEEQGRNRVPGDVFAVVLFKAYVPCIARCINLSSGGPRRGSDLVVVVIVIRNLSEIRTESNVGPDCPIGFDPTSSV